MRFALIVSFALLTAGAGTAWAGGCPTCASDQDCIDQGGPPESRCVEWFDDFGCGQQRIACCPGQGCAVRNGEASCVTDNNCRYFGAADAGSPDTGGGVDLGPPPDLGGADSGPADNGGADLGRADSGNPPGDTGNNAGDDAGQSSDTGAVGDGGSAPDDDEGCGCRTSTGPTTGAAWAAAFALAALFRRRRR